MKIYKGLQMASGASKLLIPVSNPTALYNDALRYAAQYGNTECVKLFIPVSDPKVVKELGLTV